MKQSKQSARRRIVKTKVAKKTFRATVGPFILAERLRLRMPTAKGRITVFPAGYRCLLVAKGSKHSLRLLFFAAFWSAKSGAKTDPPTKKAKRRGLTLAPGDYSRVCKQTVPSARAFSPHLFERLFCQAGFIRRHSGGKDASGTSKKHRSLRSPLEAVLNRRIIVRSGKKSILRPACPEREAVKA